MTEAAIRAAGPGDLPAVAATYAGYVERTVVTFETAVPDPNGVRSQIHAGVAG